MRKVMTVGTVLFIATLAGCMQTGTQGEGADKSHVIHGDTTKKIACELPSQARWSGGLISSPDQLKPPYTDDDRGLVSRALAGDAVAVTWVESCLGASLPS